MPVEVSQEVFTETLAERLRRPRRGNDVVVHWLGQAGFVISAGRHRVLVDPYLSDTLAEKYRGTPTPHERLMLAPVDVDGLGPIDLVLITHHHTDHMDPGTLAALARLHPPLRFVVPRASRAEATRRVDVPESRLVLMDAGEAFAAAPDLRIEAIRAAHETLERDADGHHRFLGYVLVFGKEGSRPVKLLHSGDTIPFSGQIDDIKNARPDVLLLPVNGRSAELAARGVAGNLTLAEAVRLTRETGTPVMIAHHHGLFAFNTLPLEAIEEKAKEPNLSIRLLAAREGVEVRLRLT